MDDDDDVSPMRSLPRFSENAADDGSPNVLFPYIERGIGLAIFNMMSVFLVCVGCFISYFALLF